MRPSGVNVPIITLTTDFGERSGFVGVMKGVIWGICPEARIADISHHVAPQNILEAAYVLGRAVPFFPPGSVHVAVVDPGVGTARRPLAMQLGSHYFVGPDNGVFTPLIENAERSGAAKFIVLTNKQYWLSNISRTFHGRDIFAPVAAHLASGVPLLELGVPITDPLRLSMPKPERTAVGWRAHITVVDTFGNLATDLPAEVVLGVGELLFRVGGREVHGLVESYGHRPSGELVALVDSENYIEIAIVNGNAAQNLGACVGDLVEVTFSV